jgi:RNA polymerase sigma-70 factor (ECF subfamily)
MLEAARAACPQLHIPAEPFFSAALALPTTPTPEQLAELGLAVACTHGDPKALRRFEQHHFGAARRTLTRMLHDTEAVEDVLQQLRHRLFVPTDDNDPAVVRAVGKGNLTKFVRVCAVRLALNHMRTEQRWAARNERVGQRSLGEMFEDPELRLGRSVSSSVVAAGFEHAVATLTPKQRNLLRHQLIDHLSLDQLATRYRVHRRTIARWLAAARQAVVTETRAEVERRLGDALPPSGLGWLAHSRLELSITRVLEGYASTQIPVST